MTTPHSPPRLASQLVAPRRRRRRSWLSRQRSSRRGRFELALLGGGTIALVLAGTLPALSQPRAVATLLAGGVAMFFVATIVGFVPAMVAAAFAPLVVALSDPMWTLGASLADFTLGNESSATFGVFLSAAVLGGAFRQWRRRRSARSGRNIWRATP